MKIARITAQSRARLDERFRNSGQLNGTVHPPGDG